MKTFPTDWKRSYWPEPRLGTAETRRDVLVRLGKIQPRSKRKNAVTLDSALSALTALAERR